MTNRCSLGLAAILMFSSDVSGVSAQAIMQSVPGPINHPAVVNLPVRSSGVWRKGVEKFGENLVSGSLRLRGYEILDSKIPGNHGIDLVARKLNAMGMIVDMKIMEVKSHYGTTQPRLGQTKVGTQMSRDWLCNNLKKLRLSGPEGRKIALDISHFRKSQGVPIERLGEVHDVNLRSGKYTVRNPINLSARAGLVSIDRLLADISKKSGSDWRSRTVADVPGQPPSFGLRKCQSVCP